uniref:Uncharacterized protein n=1 Tax=Cucumis melo TaxID=3656 RepID=A0A9I9EHG7_CUCME
MSTLELTTGICFELGFSCMVRQGGKAIRVKLNILHYLLCVLMWDTLCLLCDLTLKDAILSESELRITPFVFSIENYCFLSVDSDECVQTISPIPINIQLKLHELNTFLRSTKKGSKENLQSYPPPSLLPYHTTSSSPPAPSLLVLSPSSLLDCNIDEVVNEEEPTPSKSSKDKKANRLDSGKG